MTMETIEDEDRLFSVLEAEECPECGQGLVAIEVSGIPEFLRAHGYQPYQGTGTDGVAHFTWTLHPMLDDRGVFSFECLKCGIKFEVRHTIGLDWVLAEQAIDTAERV